MRGFALLVAATLLAACQPGGDAPVERAVIQDDLSTVEGRSLAFVRDAGVAEFLATSCDSVALRDGSAEATSRAFVMAEMEAGTAPDAIATALTSVEPAVVQTNTQAYVAARGLRVEGADPCDGARAEMADGTGVGRLLVDA